MATSKSTSNSLDNTYMWNSKSVHDFNLSALFTANGKKLRYPGLTKAQYSTVWAKNIGHLKTKAKAAADAAHKAEISGPVTPSASSHQSGTAPALPPAPSTDGYLDTLLGYRWNLPPHKWSRPLSAADLSAGVASNPRSGTAGKVGTYANMAMRRGRIKTIYANPTAVYAVNSNDTQTGLTDITSGATNDASKIGFQFMWNPESFGTSVALSTGVVPTAADSIAKDAGVFPGMESVSLNIRLDRTNDFACFKGLADRNAIANLLEFYPDKMPGQRTALGESLTAKVSDLLDRGTGADLEYLYKTINGPNQINNTGLYTSADFGFLRYTLVKIELGPLGYLAYITGVSVNHIAFTEDYIPIRTDVTITANVTTNANVHKSDPAVTRHSYGLPTHPRRTNRGD